MTIGAEERVSARNHVAWHRAECWGYTADLGIWRELAGDRPSRVLDLGAGAGRVAIDLSRRGHRVTALDFDPVLLRALDESEPSVITVEADARRFELPISFDLVLAPMQTLQLLTDPEGRRSCLACVRRHMHAGSVFAAAYVEFDLTADSIGRNLLEGQPVTTDLERLEPDLFAGSSSTGLFLEAGDRLRIRRQRQIISRPGNPPLSGHEIDFELALLSRAQVEAEFDAAGLQLSDWRSIAPTENHMGAAVAIARAACQSA